MGIMITMEVTKDTLIGGALQDNKASLLIATPEGTLKLQGTERDMKELVSEMRKQLDAVSEEIKHKK